jgi:hypothetical protein
MFTCRASLDLDQYARRMLPLKKVLADALIRKRSNLNESVWRTASAAAS